MKPSENSTKLFSEIRNKCAGSAVLIANTVPFKANLGHGVLFTGTTHKDTYLILVCASVKEGAPTTPFEHRIRCWDSFKTAAELQRCLESYEMPVECVLERIKTNVYQLDVQHRDIFDHTPLLQEIIDSVGAAGEITDTTVAENVHQLLGSLPLSRKLYGTLGVLGVVELECAIQMYITSLISVAMTMIKAASEKSKTVESSGDGCIISPYSGD